MHSERDSWPPLHCATTPAAIAEIIEHVDGLEEAIHALAMEIERLSAGRDRREAQAADN